MFYTRILAYDLGGRRRGRGGLACVWKISYIVSVFVVKLCIHLPGLVSRQLLLKADLGPRKNALHALVISSWIFCRETRRCAQAGVCNRGVVPAFSAWEFRGHSKPSRRGEVAAFPSFGLIWFAAKIRITPGGARLSPSPFPSLQEGGIVWEYLCQI